MYVSKEKNENGFRIEYYPIKVLELTVLKAITFGREKEESLRQSIST